MEHGHIRVGFALCGSFCTHRQALAALARVAERYGDVTPIVSELSAAADTRFGPARDFLAEIAASAAGRRLTPSPRPSPSGPRPCWTSW